MRPKSSRWGMSQSEQHGEGRCPSERAERTRGTEAVTLWGRGLTPLPCRNPGRTLLGCILCRELLGGGLYCTRVAEGPEKPDPSATATARSGTWQCVWAALRGLPAAGFGPLSEALTMTDD